MDMVERVARAMDAAEDKYWAAFPVDYPMTDESVPMEVLARAAIEAMREPTEEMLLGGFEADTESGFGARSVWAAMIDAALTSSSPASS